MPKDFQVTVSGARAADFMAVFGTATVCVRSPLPEVANLPGIGRALVYQLDLETIGEEERSRLVQHIAGRFGIPAGEVEREMDSHGVPILAEDCAVAVHNPLRWMT